MANKKINNVKLGAFVLAGLVFLVLMLYLIGKNRNMFGATYVLKARFDNIQGLVSGNNVRYAGIGVGTVKNIKILNDTVIEVTMIIEKKMLTIIRKNAIASIGTEGLVGNKVVNISPSHQPAELASPGDIIQSKKTISTDEMLATLNKTNNDVAVIAEEIKSTIKRINGSVGLWSLLNDQTIPLDIKASLANVKHATQRADKMAADLQGLVADIRSGKGSVGALLTDTSFATNLNEAILKIKEVGDEADALAIDMRKLVAGVNSDVNNGTGTAHALLKDSSLVMKLNASLDNIQKGTDGFNQNMEALKHNFLFRGFFKKQEKQKKKEAAQKNNP